MRGRYPPPQCLFCILMSRAMDKADFLWYNVDMNDIVFAGTPAEAGEHKHRGWEILCPSSRGEMDAGGAVIEYKRGDVIIVPRQVLHSNDGVQLSCVIENAMIAPSGVRVISGAPAADLAWACRRAEWYVSSDIPKKQVVLDGLGAFIRSLVAAYCGGNDFSPAVKNVLAEIEKGLSDPLFSLENSIKSLPLNYDYVRKLFKKEVGQTPLEYLTAKRMSLAREIILSGITNRYSNYTISQIAEMCGFAEPLYFSRVFKKYYGVSPTEYVASNK